MKNMKKKGFTLVELLVVIAIIAILATVSVVGYTAFIDKANTSADHQAITQINTALKAEGVSENPENIREVQLFLDACQLDIDGYKPLSKDTFFFWDKSQNIVVYTDKNYAVTYPEGYVADAEGMADWFSLSGEIREEAYTGKISDGTVTVANAEQLFKVAQDYKGNDTLVVNLPADTTINMMGASLAFDGVNTSLKIVGDNTVISNIAQTEVSILATNAAGQLQEYGGGLIANAQKGADIYFEGITLKDSIFGNSASSTVGAFVGKANAEIANIKLENCHVINSTIIADYRAGAFIGMANGNTLVEFEDCSVEDVTVITERGWGGLLMGLKLGTEADKVVGAQDVELKGTNKVVYNGNGVEGLYNAYKPNGDIYYGEDGIATDALYFQYKLIDGVGYHKKVAKTN